jgi:low affinity Fe/Cu permease
MYPYPRSPFSRFAKWTAHATGHPLAFVLAALIVVVWLVTGPLFRFSDTWQLVINTGTTIVTFLMVFLIQNTQNRDSAAVQLKLDELIRAAEGAHNALLDLEELAEADLERLRGEYEALARHARDDLRRGRRDVDTPQVAGRPEATGGWGVAGPAGAGALRGGGASATTRGWLDGGRASGDLRRH